MPQTKSAAKRLRQNIKSRKRNRTVLARLKTGMRDFTQQIEEGKSESARAALKKVYSLLDRALTQRVVKRNYVSRQKSRLTARFNSLGKSE